MRTMERQKVPVIRLNLCVMVAGWNQAGKVGGGGKAGAFQPEMTMSGVLGSTMLRSIFNQVNVLP